MDIRDQRDTATNAGPRQRLGLAVLLEPTMLTPDVYPERTRRGPTRLADGTLHAEHTVVDGLENAPPVLTGVLGANSGKMPVRLTTAGAMREEA
ncbi:hypothetical protein LHJ74_06870 [Streptomyces sp. N2-109]|uniref:Uncharacterized protein n=1 Tax=Streptomyces gossypii TaxID=2883101 RepID=A0ABT2JPH8_9ACTN|nr:hypothetical protein [Streptomyces gossypii]MCT2589646.1 hypothetical protein [Streptomyces gossypii]